MSRLQPLAGVTLQQPIGPMLSVNPPAAPYGLKRSDAAQIPATARKPLQHPTETQKVFAGEVIAAEEGLVLTL